MAVINSVAVGAAKGKVGNLVYSRNAGRTIAREYQPNVKNPNTPEQQAQRGKMKEIIILYNALASALTGSFAGRKRTLSVFNAFVSANVGAMSGETDGTIEAVLEERPEIKIANGNLGNLNTTCAGTSVSANFYNLKSKLKVGDKITLFAITQNGETVIETKTIIDLQDNIVTWTWGSLQNVIGAGAFIKSKDGRKSTNSTIVWTE